TAVNDNDLTVVRGYGSTAVEGINDDDALRVLGNAALEGDDAPTARFTNRVRRQNVTQIFTAGVEVSGSQLAAQQIGVADEMDYQKQERLRELLRDLENCVVNGVAPASDAQGSASVRRSMNGIIPMLSTNVTDAAGAQLDEATLNQAMRTIWENASGGLDTIVVSGYQKRQINSFIASARGYDARNTRYRDLLSVYESDFGVCRVVLSRWVPADCVLFLDSSRVDVMPLQSRSFQFKPLSADGDRENGQVIGEYTLELRNESAHGLLTNLATEAA
ncbi:MAG: DUF5309 family protein, partial [Planctomycetota bacterium]